MICIQCGQHNAIFARWIRKGGRCKKVWRSRRDHPLCPRCYRSEKDRFYAFALAGGPTDTDAQWAQNILDRWAEIEQIIGRPLARLTDIKVALRRVVVTA